jgi:hypothetical protein
MKLTLAVIVKDELEQVERIINKYSCYFDYLIFAVDKSFEDFKKLENEKIKFYQYEWCNDFSHKRNWLADKVETDYYFRIDCDDDIDNPEKIKEVFNKCSDRGMDVVYFPYIYSRDSDGNCNARHWRETIIKKRKDIYWKKPIHENIFVENLNDYRGIKCEEVKIIHNLTPEHALESQKRNLKLLMEEFKRDKENTDPRTIGYIGRMLMGVGEYQRAIPFLELLIKKSGWDDDKYFAWVHLSDCHHYLGNDDFAIASCNEALAINTRFPDAYIKMGGIYYRKRNSNRRWIG